MVRKHRRKWLGTAIVLIAVAMPPATASAFLNTDAAWTKLFSYLLSFVGEPGEFEVKVGRVTNPLSGNVTIENVTLTDSQGTWFSLDRALLKWNPLRLLSGKMVIEDLQLDRPVVSRLPVPSADAAMAEKRPENPLELPSLPEGVNIHRLHIANGVLGEAVGGERATFEADGKLVTDDGESQLDVAFSRTDRPTDSFNLAFRQKDGERLKIDLVASGTRDGLIARNSGLDLSQPLRVELHGDGPPDNWSGRLDTRIGDYLVGSASVEAAWAKTFRIDADGQFGFGADAPDSLRAQGRNIVLDVRAVTQPNGGVVFERAHITSSAVTLAMTATMPPSRDSIDGLVKGELTDQTAFAELLPAGLKLRTPSFRVAFSGPFDSLAYQGTVSAAGVAMSDMSAEDIDLSLALRPAAGGADYSLALDATARSPKTADAATNRVLGERIALTSRGTVSPAAWRLALSELSLTTSAVKYSGDLSVDGRQRRLAGNGELRLADLSALSALAGTPLEGSAVVTLDNLSYALSGAVTGRIEAAFQSLAVGDGATRYAANAPVTLGARLDAETENGTYRIDGLHLTGGGIDLRGVLAANIRRGTAEGQLNARIEDLRMLPQTSGAVAGGGATLTLTAEDRTADKVIHARFSAQGTGLALPDRALSQAVGPSPEIRGILRLGADGVLAVEISRLTAAAASATGTVSLDAQNGNALDGKVDLRLPALSRLSALAGTPLSGSARGNLTFGGTAASPTGRLETSVSGLAVGNAPIGDIRGILRLSPVRNGRRLNAAFKIVDGAASPGSLDANAILHGNGSTILDTLVLRAFRAEISGKATISPNGLATGRLAVDIPRLQTLAAPLQLDGLGGYLDGRIELSAPDGRQTVAVDATLTGLEWQSPGSDTTGFSAREVTMGGRIADVSGEGRLSATLAASRLKAGPRDLKSARLTLAGTMKAPEFQAQVDGEKIDATLAGRADLASKTPAITLDRLDGSLAGTAIRLYQPVRITVGDAIEVADLSLGVGKGRFDGSFRQDQQGIRVTLNAEALPLSLAEIVAPDLVIAGTLNGTVKANTGAPRGSADVKVKLRELQFASTRLETPSMGADLDLRWDGETASLDIALDGIGKQPFRLEAAVPLGADDSGLPAIRGSGRLSGSLAWEGPVEALWAYVPVSDHSLAGDAALDLSLGGTISKPALSGRVAIRNGVYEHLIYGAVVRNLDLVVTSGDSREFDFRLTATDGGDGRFEGNGRLDLAGVLAGRTDAFADITFSASRAVVVRRDELVGEIDSDLAFRNTDGTLRLAGDITVRHVEARLINDMPPSVADMPVIEVNRGEAGQTAANAADEDEEDDDRVALPFEVDITVSIPSRFFVRGRGLDSEWGGELKVTGSDPVNIVGSIIARRGQFDIGGKAFELSDESNISFDGGEINPRVNVSATYDGPEISATIQLTGPATAPSLTLSSVPAYPESEILSRALFNQSPQSLSGFQAATLASSAATLSGIGGGPGVLGQIREKLGLDVVRMSSDSAGEPGVTVGKYVADNVFVGATQGAAAGTTAAKVEVELTDSITIESDVGAVSGSNIGINWEWKY